MDDGLNHGVVFECPLAKEWAEHRREAKEAMAKIADTYKLTSILVSDTSRHLASIDKSNANSQEILTEIKNQLIGAILGKEIVPMGVTQKMLENQKIAYESMLESQRKSYVSILRTLCWAFAVILGVLIALRHWMPDWFKTIPTEPVNFKQQETRYAKDLGKGIYRWSQISKGSSEKQSSV